MNDSRSTWAHDRLIGRRAMLLGAAAALGCGPTSEQWQTRAVVGSGSRDHWTLPLFGVSPYKMVAVRGIQVPPPILGFLEGWDSEGFDDTTRAAAASSSSQQAEVYWGSNSDVVALWGVPAGVNPGMKRSDAWGTWAYQGVNRAGVMQFGDGPSSRAWHCLLVFPGGPWVFASAAAAPRLAGAWGAGMTAPFPCALAPGALCIEQVGADSAQREASTFGGRDSEYQILGLDRIVERTTATYPALPGSDVPTSLTYLFDRPGAASLAASDLQRAKPSIDANARYFPGLYFWGTLRDVRVDGPAMTLQGLLPYESFSGRASR